MESILAKLYIIACIYMVIRTIVQYFWSKKKYPDEQRLTYTGPLIIWESVIIFIGMMIYLLAESAVSSKWVDVNIRNPWIIFMLRILTLIGPFLSLCGVHELLNIFVYTEHIDDEYRQIKKMREIYGNLSGVEPENEDLKQPSEQTD